MKIKPVIYFVTVCFFVFVHFILFSFSFSQDKDNLEKLALPFPVDFTEREIKFINSLSQTDLEKLIRIIKMIIEKNKLATNSKINQFFSNTPSRETPYYNPSTGQYQSAPPSTSGGGGGGGVGNIGSGGGGNSGGNSSGGGSNLPFSGEQSSPLGNGLLSPQNSLSQTPLGALAQGLNQGLNQGINPQTNDTNLNVKDIDPMCIPNYGIKHMSASGCSSIGGLDERVKRITMEACTLIKQQIPVNSAYRSPYCNNLVGGAEHSNHKRGIAIDVSLGLLGEKASTVVLKFKQSGLVGFRCYGASKHTHFSLSQTEKDDLRKCPPIVQQIYR